MTSTPTLEYRSNKTNNHSVRINQKRSPLLRLPAELRSRIYDYVFDSKSIEILHDDHHEWDRLDFSRTCRQIFSETAHDCFKNRLLPISSREGVSCSDLEMLQSTFSKLTRSLRRCVKTVVLHADIYDGLKDAMKHKLLKDLPHLQIFGYQAADAMMFGFLKDPRAEDEMSREIRPYTNALVKVYAPEHVSINL